VKKNHNYFSPTVILVSLFVISAVVFTGWYILKNNPTNNIAKSTKSYINQGPGMSPTLADGQRINGKVIPASEVQRGDIIVFKPPVTEAERFVKRVVGLPGDTVNIENGTLTVAKADGSTYSPGLSGASSTQKISKLVTANSFFVVGDNLSNSLDSRVESFGLVPYSSLQSVVVF
jgi:signal peptidase I